MKKLPESTGKKRGKRTELEAWIGAERPAMIGLAEFERIRVALAPVSESYLLRLLRECGLELAPMVAGVRQGNFDELEASLMALGEEYLRGDQMAVRRLVITAKEHARFAAKRNPEKEEMVLWMITWLENPPVFADWVRLRRARGE